MEECTCNRLMMADHNAVCKACSEKLLVSANVNQVDHINNVDQAVNPDCIRETQIRRDQCTCNIRMMVDHNAMCEACSHDIE